jgi:four helix bundle protein
MLRIYDVMLEFVRDLRPVVEAIQKRDAGLADQLRRALQSVVLNTAEGMGSRGRNRQVRYHSALGSMRETAACLELGAAFGYIAPPSAAMRNRIAHLVGTLVKLT